MKMLTFSSRTAKEILRDPVNLGFGLGFPVVLILLLSAIQANIPVSMFEIENLAPGMTVFGLSFMTLFAATLIAKDRESALLQRLYTTPLTAADFIFGYTLPLLPIALGADDNSRLSVFHCARASVRQCPERKAGRRHMRRAADKPHRMAVRHMV